jgi:hypothetical protein
MLWVYPLHYPLEVILYYIYTYIYTKTYHTRFSAVLLQNKVQYYVPSRTSIMIIFIVLKYLY